MIFQAAFGHMPDILADYGIHDSQGFDRHYTYIIAKLLIDTIYDSQGLDRHYV
jgi:hypothetical protein